VAPVRKTGFPAVDEKTRRPPWWRRIKWRESGSDRWWYIFLLALFLLVAIVVGLGVGLTLGLRHR